MVYDGINWSYILIAQVLVCYNNWFISNLQDEKVRCPMSGKPIKLKDLIEVKFTPIKDDGKKSLITKSVRNIYCCISINVNLVVSL